MTQTITPATQKPVEWCAAVQAKLMAALDAAWALAERSDDPTVIAKARDKAKLCGQMAAEARKIAAMIPPPKPLKPSAIVSAALSEPLSPPDATPAAKPPAAQAAAMQAALAKIRRR